MAAQYDLFRISAKSPSVRDRYENRVESIEFKGVVYKADKRVLKKLSGTKFLCTKYSQCSEDIIPVPGNYGVSRG